MISTPLIAAIAGTTLANLARAAPTAECCSIIAKEYPDNVFGHGTPAWDQENHRYWSSTAVLNPSCIFLPDNTAQIAKAVVLFKDNKCKFAVKGAGHSAIPGAANIDDGVTMALAHLRSTDVKDESIRVGAGLPLGKVYEVLDPLQRAAVIGRFEKVGLGMAVSAGISYFSNLEGFAIDNVVNYEVVLASGEIVDANATSNPDLFWALKGGNNNFGIVSHYHLRTLKTAGSLYGGQLFYNESVLDAVLDATYDYHTRQAVTDGRAHALPQYYYTGATNSSSSSVIIAYNDAVSELPDVMQPWLDIPSTRNTLKKRQYGDLAIEVNADFKDGLVQEQRMITVYADAKFYKEVWARFSDWAVQFQHIPGFIADHGNMPITPRQVKAGVERGGNALGLDEGPQNRTLGILYFGVTLDNPSDSKNVFAAHKEFVESMRKFAENVGVLHRSLLVTFSGYDQPAIASYGAKNVARLHEVAEKYDPTGVFQWLVPGGQKLPPRP